ncbi:MAG: YtxH domain-containing protein [bacterium]
MSIGKFFAGFVIGGVVGGVVGLLLAPRSGEETRQLLSDNSSEICKSTDTSLKELQNKANMVMDDIQKKGDELLKKVQELVKKEQA